jgi:hypothetical protein
LNKGVRAVKKKDIKLISQVLMGSAIISVLLAGIGYLGVDIWLASTQWLLVAAILALFGLYTRMES